MIIQTIITQIKTDLNATFATIDTWFDKHSDLLAYRPTYGGWTINEILEHIALTNHFLLILIDKGAKKALQNVHNLNLHAELETYVFKKESLLTVGQHKSFQWIRPEHMEPTGQKDLQLVRNELKEQLTRCVDILDRLKNGEGILYKTTMTVNNLGRLDVYEYIYFLAQHGQRHTEQMEKIEHDFSQNRS